MMCLAATCLVRHTYLTQYGVGEKTLFAGKKAMQCYAYTHPFQRRGLIKTERKKERMEEKEIDLKREGEWDYNHHII